MTMFGSAQPETPLPPRKEVHAAGNPPPNGNFEGDELQAALQLLAERAQYITGATGAALALCQGEEMVCHASAGSSGPAVGARLQVRSGLSGESIARKQLLRCDNAETDPRVNLETCRQLGIASIVVLPLLTRTGEIRGVFELFSDHAYAFEERDLIALERMGELTLTALDLAERRPRALPVFPSTPEPAATVSQLPGSESAITQTAATMPDQPDTAPYPPSADGPPVVSVVENLHSDAANLTTPPPDQPLGAAQVHSALFQDAVPETGPMPVPEAMRRVQKCASCGFPVSEGRTLCVDCENKSHLHPESTDAQPAEFIPAFLDSSKPPNESWLANHVNVLAVVVLILSIVVAVVVFR
jgi:putative methionine-R-sulfoxide reductase with GAF domain